MDRRRRPSINDRDIPRDAFDMRDIKRDIFGIPLREPRPPRPPRVEIPRARRPSDAARARPAEPPRRRRQSDALPPLKNPGRTRRPTLGEIMGMPQPPKTPAKTPRPRRPSLSELLDLSPGGPSRAPRPRRSSSTELLSLESSDSFRPRQADGARPRRTSDAPRPKPRAVSRDPRRASDAPRPRPAKNPSPPQPTRIRTVTVDKQFVNQTETIKRYKDRGALPVHINDLVGPKNRYRVLNKLGNGSFGIVWLVEDRVDRRCRWKALKINDASGKRKEVKLQGIFESAGVTGQKALDNQICVPYELFEIHGPNGKHLASVLPILGPELDVALRDDRKLSRRGICHQVILAMQFLHNRLGIMHGDFRPANILVQIDGLQELDEAEIREVYGGDPRIIPVNRLSQKINPARCPRYLVVNAELNSEKLASLIKKKTGKRMIARRPKVAITDFGSSYHVSDTPPWDFRIPVIMNDPWCAAGGGASLQSDIWALGFTIFQLMTDMRNPFLIKGKYKTPFGDYFPNIEEAIGPMPVVLRKMCLDRRLVEEAHGQPLPRGFSLDMNPNRTATRSEEDHDKIFNKLVGHVKGASCVPHGKLLLEKDISREEADELWDLIRRCCAWLPRERPTIDQVVTARWFTSWSAGDS